jgi:hypothetical protein
VTTEEERPWRPLDPAGTAALLADLGCRWWVAGGWALDLHLGRQTRAHADMDVVLLREDQLTVQAHLGGWTLMAADPPGSLRDWEPGELLATGVHDVWCRPFGSDEWALQLMIIDPEGDDWVYRRDQRISRPLPTITGEASTQAMPVLAPEIQLLYKSHRPRAKDQRDFETFADHLTDQQREWLGGALRTADPQHPWLARL